MFLIVFNLICYAILVKNFAKAYKLTICSIYLAIVLAYGGVFFNLLFNSICNKHLGYLILLKALG